MGIGKHDKSGPFLFRLITSCQAFTSTSLHPHHGASVRTVLDSVLKHLERCLAHCHLAFSIVIVFVVDAVVMQECESTVATSSSFFGQARNLNFYVKSDF